MYDPDGRVQGNLGGSYENVAVIPNASGEGSRIWGDAVFDVATLQSTEEGREVLRRIEEGLPISMSTGLYVDLVETPSAETYNFICVWMMADHLALLPEGVEPASTTEQGTGMFVAHRRDKPVTMKMLAANMSQGGVPPLGGAPARGAPARRGVDIPFGRRHKGVQ